VLSLRAGFDPRYFVGDCIFDGLVVAELEVQERMMLDRAPVAAEQGMRTKKIDGPCDPAARALGHDQYDALAHGLAHQ
jgi:hypothetical protein